MNTKLIWWLDRVNAMSSEYVLEQAQSANVNTPVLPGHLQMALSAVMREDRWRGQLIVPVTMSGEIDTLLLDHIADEPTLTQILGHGFIGIPFEIIHYDTVKQYSGIITTTDLKFPDVCEIRSFLAEVK